MQSEVGQGLRVAGLFAGIGGVERGLESAHHHAELLCEIDPGAQAVLKRRFPDVPIHGDIATLKQLPEVDVVTAGFPCTDLSQAGRTAGIGGRQSGLVGHVFRLLEARKKVPTWLLLENVPFMLQLDRGKAMKYLTDTLDEMGYRWAYRVIDTRAFGLPQRRQRVILLASRTDDPRGVLLGPDAGEREQPADGVACGFYWTEGTRGLGWAVNAIPTLKTGSSVGIASPPAIITPEGEIVVPDIRDAERLQGFPANWTMPAVTDAGKREGWRWRLVGNAVSVPVFRWVGDRLVNRVSYEREDELLQAGESWPKAAWGEGGKVHRSDNSAWPVRRRYNDLAEFLRYPTKPLSLRGASGFLKRIQASTLRFPEGFVDAVAAQVDRMTPR